MFFKRVFFGGKLEKEVIDLIREHLDILQTSCETFKIAVETEDDSLIKRICEFENEGDRIRREIALKIYEGAFLPYLRPNIYRFAEVIDEAIDKIEDAVYDYIYLKLNGRCELLEFVREEVLTIANLNFKASKKLAEAYNSLVNGEDLSDKTVKIKIYEREVDEIKHDIHKKLRKLDVKNFWEGKTLSDFIEHLVSVTDLIEDAGDVIQIINVSLR